MYKSKPQQVKVNMNVQILCSPIKVEISKLIFEETNEDKEDKLIDFYAKKGVNSEKIEKMKGKNPPKKIKSKNKKEVKFEVKSVHTETNKLMVQKAKEAKMKMKKDTMSTKSSRRRVITEKERERNKKDDTAIESLPINKILDDFELNNLDYPDACKSDKRTFLRTYWSVLKREHSVLLTFVARNDYNLFYVKIEKFLILFCVDMTMNGLFFVHETMHRKYTENQDFTFVQKIPQLLFTLLAAYALKVILCFLGMADTHIYEIKYLPLKEKKMEKKLWI